MVSRLIEGIVQYDYYELKAIYENEPSTIIIDVRELREYEDKHIPGIPLVPMSGIVHVIDDFKKDEKYIFVCRSGRRSHEVAKFFKNNGIENVANYADGMLGWQGEVATGQEFVATDVKKLFKKKFSY